ncbi:MAG: sugar ABC transporter ATP-binding protein [Chloroflexota bacterium]
MTGIAIEFPGVKALSGVDFKAETGNIHALIGANGAGKSTLMKILAGAYNHYTGKISIDGNSVQIHTPRDAKQLGIEIVYQEVDTALVPYLSVAENIMLDVMVNRMSGRQLVRWREIHRSARQVLDHMSVKIDTHELVQNLTLAQKQMVLIARALAEDARFLVLDEPTAPLSTSETQELFRLMNDLAYNHGVGVIFISHRIPEIFEICQHVTILRDGQVVTCCQVVSDVRPLQVIEWMLGHSFDETYPKTKVPVGEKVFEVVNFSAQDGAVENINMYVRAGEVVGVAGLVGAGKTELCKALFGAIPSRSGEILLNGKKISIRTPFQAVKHGLALVPEERRKEGVLVEEPVYINISAASLGAFVTALGFLRQTAERALAHKMIDNLGIRTPSENQKVAYLSGGNQQKVAVGKWLATDAEIYVFDEPTKGVDVGAKHEIFELIGKLVAAGKGVIYASCELAEIIGITDRTYVMYDHTIAKELVTAETNEAEILFYSTGGK